MKFDFIQKMEQDGFESFEECCDFIASINGTYTEPYEAISFCILEATS